MHCEESECFGKRVDRREVWEKTDLDDGAASLQDDLVSVWRRDSRVNRRMACPKDGTVIDILRKIEPQLQILKTRLTMGWKQSVWRKKYALQQSIRLGISTSARTETRTPPATVYGKVIDKDLKIILLFVRYSMIAFVNVPFSAQYVQWWGL
jgi:hypothetical protein